MEQYQIVPWDDTLSESGMNLEQYVPPELERLAQQVCKSYDMNVSSMTLITSKPDKGGAIWRIETNRGPRSLKVLHRTPQRSLFSVGAQEYVVSKGARVPGIIHTKDRRNSVVAGGKLWIVTDWIDTLTPVAKIDLEGARTLCRGLGEFHQWSKGYVPPPEAGKSSRLFKWDSQYQKIMTKIGWFRHIANAYRETAASAHLLSVVDTFEKQAATIYKKFQESAYRKMIRKGEPHWGLAHQDYGWSNGQMGPGGIWVIDLDGVAYDLPVRDLRKIITSTMDDMGTWDLAWIRGVIDAYHAGNPLDRETFELLWIDMAFPNEFYKHVKEVVYDPVTFMNTELDAILDRVVATEANKWEVLAELEKDKAKYRPGDYTEEEPIVSLPFAYRDYAKRSRPVPPSRAAAPGARSDSRGRRIIRLVAKPDGGVEYVEETLRPLRGWEREEPLLPPSAAPAEQGAEETARAGEPVRRRRRKAVPSRRVGYGLLRTPVPVYVPASRRAPSGAATAPRSARKRKQAAKEAALQKQRRREALRRRAKAIRQAMSERRAKRSRNSASRVLLKPPAAGRTVKSRKGKAIKKKGGLTRKSYRSKGYVSAYRKASRRIAT